MRYLALATLVVLVTGCQSGMRSGSLFGSATPNQPNAVLAGNVISPPPTGSFVPPQFTAGGFTPPPSSFNAASAPGLTPSAPNPSSVTNSASPFWNRYQPLSLPSAGSSQSAPGFTPSNRVPPAGFASNFNAATPTTPPAGYPPSNPFGTSSFNSSTPNAPATYAGNNPLLAWANKFHNYLFTSTPQPGQWQSYSGSMPVSNTGGFSNNPAPGFTPTNFTPNSNAGATNSWQNRPEPRSLRTPDTYGPEPAIRIPDSALAGDVNVQPRSVAPVAPIGPPPAAFPPRNNAATQPAPAASMPPRATINAATKIVSDPAWPEITSLPRGR